MYERDGTKGFAGTGKSVCSDFAASLHPSPPHRHVVHRAEHDAVMPHEGDPALMVWRRRGEELHPGKVVLLLRGREGRWAEEEEVGGFEDGGERRGSVPNPDGQVGGEVLAAKD